MEEVEAVFISLILMFGLALILAFILIGTNGGNNGKKDVERDMERKVGDVFEFEGRKYKCVKSFKLDKVNCHICAFSVIDCKHCPSECYHGYRKDGKEVYFIEVKE